MASGDSVYVAWRDSRNGKDDIYFNIPFGTQPYGEGTRGTGDVTPRLDGTDSVSFGSTFKLNCHIPVDNAFLGLNLNFQAALLDPGAGACSTTTRSWSTRSNAA